MLISWIVVGASPSAEIALRKAVARRPDSMRMTTNAGIHLFNGDRLDYYWLTDKYACENHRADREAAIKRGTQIVTFDSGVEFLKKRGLENADVFISPKPRIGPAPHYKYRQNIDICFSGMWCVQFALDHDATELHLCGLEGYRSTRGDRCVEYFNGKTGLKLGQDYTRIYIRPFLQSCLDECPDTKFILYGKPAYEITGPNLEVVSC